MKRGKTPIELYNLEEEREDYFQERRLVDYILAAGGSVEVMTIYWDESAGIDPVRWFRITRSMAKRGLIKIQERGDPKRLSFSWNYIHNPDSCQPTPEQKYLDLPRLGVLQESEICRGETSAKKEVSRGTTDKGSNKDI